jgi:hypothetical protein
MSATTGLWHCRHEAWRIAAFFGVMRIGSGSVSLLQRHVQPGLELRPNVWFGNVESIASERNASETVTYVSNIRKRSVADARASGIRSYNGHQGDHMRISTVREFRDKATGLLRSRTPILVTRRGRLAGIFFPRPEITLPIELKRELYDMLSSDIARQLKRRKVSEDDVLGNFEASRKRRRATRRRR